MDVLQNNETVDVDTAELYLGPTKVIVNAFNARKMAELGTEIRHYEVRTRDQHNRVQQLEPTQVAVGCKAIILKNHKTDEGRYLFNGQRCLVTGLYDDSVQVQLDDGSLHVVKRLSEIKTQKGGSRDKSFIPITARYALTIHKSQGQTVDSLVVDMSGLFTEGMAYVALSRCTNLLNVKITGWVKRTDKGWVPNSDAYQFCTFNRACGADEMLFIKDEIKQLTNVTKHRWEAPRWNHIYLDFETYNVAGTQKPYYNHILHQIDGSTVKEMSLFDELW